MLQSSTRAQLDLRSWSTLYRCQSKTHRVGRCFPFSGHQYPYFLTPVNGERGALKARQTAEPTTHFYSRRLELSKTYFMNGPEKSNFFWHTVAIMVWVLINE